MNTEPIRVLQVVGKMHYGGMETLIMNMYRNIDRNKVQFDFLVHYEEAGEYDEEILRLGGRIYKMPRTVPQNYFKYKRALADFFREHSEYKVVHGHLQSTAFLYHKIAKQYGVKCCITHAHANGTENNIKGKLAKVLSLAAQKYTDYFFGCSNEACEYFFPKAIKSGKKMTIIKNGIDIEKYIYSESTREKVRKDFNLEGKTVIGHIGRFSEVKNHEFLLDVFNELHKINKETVLMLVGTGPLFETVKKKVKELNLEDSVIFTGARSDIPELLQAMDVFVLPSLFEGLGIVLIEAQAAGLRCFASDTVPESAKVTDLLEYISLNENPNYWAEKILRNTEYKREDTSDAVRKSGYDIKETANWIQKFYINKNE